MLRVEKVATPTTAATCVVPARVPPPGLVPMLTVTLPVKPVRVLPKTSWAVTRTGALIAAPAVVLLGGTVKTSWLAVPGSTVKLGLGGGAAPPPAGGGGARPTLSFW